MLEVKAGSERVREMKSTERGDQQGGTVNGGGSGASAQPQGGTDRTAQHRSTAPHGGGAADCCNRSGQSCLRSDGISGTAPQISAATATAAGAAVQISATDSTARGLGAQPLVAEGAQPLVAEAAQPPAFRARRGDR